MDIERILNDYRNGDEDKRLGLFLTYRHLRDEFSAIDQDKPGYLFSVPPLFRTGFLRNVIKTVFDVFRKE